MLIIIPSIEVAPDCPAPPHRFQDFVQNRVSSVF